MHRMPVVSASGRRSPREWLPALILALLLASSASADVVIKETVVSEGLSGFGNGTTQRTMIVAGDKSRFEDENTYTGRFKTFAGGGKPRTSVSITRLDKEVIWSVDPPKQQYSEMTFDEMRKMMAAGAAEIDKNKSAPADAEMTFTVDVQRTGAKQDINGFPAEQVIVTCVGAPKNPQKGSESAGFRMVMDQWLTKSAPGAQEMADFQRRFAEKLGLDAEMSSVNPMARRMYGSAMKELAEKLKGLGGFAVKSTFLIEGSPAMAAAQQQSASEAESQRAQAKDARARAKETEATEEKRTDAAESAEIGAGALSGNKGALTGGLGGLLGRKVAKAAQKKAEDKADKKAEEMTSSGGGAAGGPLFKVVTEVTSISTSPAPAGSFDVPAGYKLQSKNEVR
jgi:hypothetical protein